MIEQKQTNSSADSGLLKWIFGGVALSLLSYSLFRALLNTPEASAEAPNGFSHFGAEVTSAFVGTGLTVAITALLLKFQTDKQTEQQEKLLKQQNEHAENLLKLQAVNDEKMRAVEAGHNAELLDKQFVKDADKEKGVTVFATKTEVYKALLDELGEIISKPILREDDFSQLTLLTLRAAYVADPRVIGELSNFAVVLRAAVTGPNDLEDIEEDEQDKQITRAERRKILFAFSKVSQLIRQDLIADPVDTELIQSIIDDLSAAGKNANTTANGVSGLAPTKETTNNEETSSVLTRVTPDSPKPAASKMTTAQFLEQCKEPGEKEFFEGFIPLLEANKFVPLWTQKGFSIEKTVRFHPSEQIFPKWRSYIERPALSKRREKVEAALAAAGVNIHFTEKPDLRFDWEQMKSATPEGFLEIVKAVLR